MYKCVQGQEERKRKKNYKKKKEEESRRETKDTLIVNEQDEWVPVHEESEGAQPNQFFARLGIVPSTHAVEVDSPILKQALLR